MNKNVEKILTKDLVHELGFEKTAVITADMLDGYTSIGYAAFSSCFDLMSIEIPNSVTSIGDGAFCVCSGLTSVTIPNSVTSIGAWAFCGCNALTSVTIPNSVTSIESRAFYKCTGLTSINVASDNSNYCSVDGILFNKDKTTLIQYPVGKEGDYTIPNSVTSIGNYAFAYCTGLTSVTIPNSDTSIGEGAFVYCSVLTSIEIPNSVTSIGDEAFYWCTSLTSVSISGIEYKPKTVTNGKCKAYKAFNGDMKCRDFQYKEGETYEFNGTPELCRCGFHACLSLADVFNYYYGNLGEDIVVHEVEIEGVNYKKHWDSKVVAKKITIGKRIL